ncbi:MAG TPA: hypothetical protein VFV49_05855 [Thermoanaerobaculia bacterium]|nr:hypothetical protein [Thermoanaerobaculia bacterium]
MTVDAAGDLQTRYGHISDRFKATWTSHQFASGVFGQILGEDLPYEIEFKLLFERIKSAGRILNGTYPNEVTTLLDNLEEDLDRASQMILAADARLSPSLLRRFFDRLKQPDDSLVDYLIKFYLYADAVEGDRRDKLDLLFTRVGEDFHPEREEFVVREALGLRQHIIELVSLLRVATAPREEVVRLIRALKTIREDIEAAAAFDDFAERNLLKDARTFKHRVGDLYFDPDVLMAIIEMNVAAKNRFHRLYGNEERRLVEDADKLMQHGAAIERNFGDANPALAGEFAHFRLLREQFDSSRAQSNVKHDVVARLKASMNTILAQLDQGLDPEIETAELPATFFEEARKIGSMTARFGRTEPLLEYVLRIDAAIEAADPSLTAEELVEHPAARELRLEPWEASAYQKLVDRLAPEAEEDTEELWLLYVRGAALRLKIDEEATILATAISAGARPEEELLAKAKKSLDLAKSLDEQFGDLQQEAVYYSNRRILRQLYRSRFRLLRGFSGLWLIYDRQG